MSETTTENAVTVSTQPLVTRDLFNVSAFDNTPEIGKVFGLTPVLSKGAAVGGNFAMGKRSDVAKNLGLTGKANSDALDTKIREVKAEAMTAVKKHIMGLSTDWVLHKFTTRVLSDGTKQQTMVTREMKAQDRAMALKYLVAMGFATAEAEEILAKKAKQNVTLETTVTTSAPAAAPSAIKK